jgi:hypothetical protein
MALKWYFVMWNTTCKPDKHEHSVIICLSIGIFHLKFVNSNIQILITKRLTLTKTFMIICEMTASFLCQKLSFTTVNELIMLTNNFCRKVTKCVLNTYIKRLHSFYNKKIIQIHVYCVLLWFEQNYWFFFEYVK